MQIKHIETLMNAHKIDVRSSVSVVRAFDVSMFIIK